MQKIITIMKDIFDPVILRMLTVVFLIAFLFPIFFSSLEFRHTIAGKAKATLFIYDIPALIAVVIVKLYATRVKSNPRPIFLFLSVWALSTFFISNSICSPFILDVILFSIYSPKSLHSILNFPSEIKFLISYFAIYKAIGFQSLLATGIAYGLFIISYKIWPLKSIDYNWSGLTASIKASVNCVNQFRQRIGYKRKLRSILYPAYMACLLGFVLFPINKADMPTNKVYKQFRSIDRDGNGFIDKDEFLEWIQSQGGDDAMADDQFSKIDSNHDQVIDFSEWKKYDTNSMQR